MGGASIAFTPLILGLICFLLAGLAAGRERGPVAAALAMVGSILLILTVVWA